MAQRTTTELMKILGVTGRSVARIAAREKWERLRNANHGLHVYEVSDKQISVFQDRAIQSPENRLEMQRQSTSNLLNLLDRRV